MRHLIPNAPLMKTGRLSSLEIAASQRGAAAVEFALAAPVLLAMLMGTLDMGQMAYGKAVLQGAVYEAARSSTLETADTKISDKILSKTVSHILPGVEISTKRTSYYDFDDIARPEAWNDANNSGICDNEELYTDENGNGQWDSDIGVGGNGSAGDVVVYEVLATYDPIFAVPLISSDKERTIAATTTIKKNQPFALQEQYGSDTGVCD